MLWNMIVVFCKNSITFREKKMSQDETFRKKFRMKIDAREALHYLGGSVSKNSTSAKYEEANY